MSRKKQEAERALFGGATHFVNRFAIQRYADGGVRLVFAEQFTADKRIPPAFRAAVYLTQESWTELRRMLDGEAA